MARKIEKLTRETRKMARKTRHSFPRKEKGNLVDILSNNNLPAAAYTFKWDASEFSSGVYFIEIKTSKETVYKKAILAK